MKILDHGYVSLVETWGSDRSIIEAARMSTAKGFQGWGPLHGEGCLGDDSLIRNDGNVCRCVHRPGDEKLLTFLMKNKHHTPFEMAGAIFEVKLPIFVVREWHRHRTQSYNEMSGRYTTLPNECYVPSVDRLMSSKRSKMNKQGSQEGLDESVAVWLQEKIRHCYLKARKHYEIMIEAEVAPEIARLVLPVNQYTVMRASANLRNWFQFLALRLPANAQWEIRQYAEAISTLLSTNFPKSHSLFLELK